MSDDIEEVMELKEEYIVEDIPEAPKGILSPESFMEKQKEEVADCYTAEGDGPWIITYSGIKMHLAKPIEDEILIQDIAHALSQLCRFVGHTRKFYSVAEHSIHVSEACSDENALWGLLHDASEAYTNDMSGPMKSYMPEFKVAEDKIQKTIADRFGLPWPMPQEVKDMDIAMLATEATQLMPRSEFWVPDLSQEPLNVRVKVPMTSEQAKQKFLERATKLFRMNKHA